MYLSKTVFLNLTWKKAEWQCNISMTKYCKDESGRLQSIKWKGCTMLDEMNGMDFGVWTQRNWNHGKIM